MTEKSERRGKMRSLGVRGTRSSPRLPFGLQAAAPAMTHRSAPPQNFAGLQRLKYRSSAEYIGP